MKDILVSFLRIYHGTTLDDPAHSSAGKLPGGMFPSQHNVQQNSQCINIRTPIRLGEPILFRCCKACGSKNLCIFSVFIFINSGSIKIDKNRFGSTYDHIIWLYISMYNSQGMKHPQSHAQLAGDLLCLCRCQKSTL